MIDLNEVCGLWECQNEGSALVTHCCDVLNDGNLKGVLNSEAILELLGVALPKDLVLLVTLATLEVAHILNDSDGRYFELIEHLDAFDYVYVRQLLGGRYYHSRFYVHFLAQSNLDISGTRWEIHYQVVQLAPVGVANQLIYEVRGYGASHNGCSVTLCGILSYETIAHSLHSAEFNGCNHRGVVFILEELSVFRADHGGQTGPIEISIEYSN